MKVSLFASLTASVVALLVACSRRSPLLEPSAKKLAAVAPDSFRVAFQTSRGNFTVAAHRAWSPAAVDRFHYLVTHGFYDGARFFRVVPGFVAQFGITGKPGLDSVWTSHRLPDEPVKHSNTRGTLAFARSGPRTRSVQLFINLANNERLDTSPPPGDDGEPLGFPPFAEVIEGMSVVDSLYGGYGEGPPRSTGPDQGKLRKEGNAYLERAFPKLDSIVATRVIERWD
jgi:peptidyl-prolyl cis-trans isomerase A (cyclophilin A)